MAGPLPPGAGYALKAQGLSGIARLSLGTTHNWAQGLSGVARLSLGLRVLVVLPVSASNE